MLCNNSNNNNNPIFRYTVDVRVFIQTDIFLLFQMYYAKRNYCYSWEGLKMGCIVKKKLRHSTEKHSIKLHSVCYLDVKK